MDTAIILTLHLIISIATHMGPNTPKVEYVQPTPVVQTVEAKTEQDL